MVKLNHIGIYVKDLRARTRGRKFNHFGVHTSDYDGFIVKMNDMGIDYWEMSLSPGKRLVNFTDPSGHDIEVCETSFKD